MSAPVPDASRRSSRARDAILAAARELVASDGYRGLSIEGIAARAGVGKQTIYRWWPSKGAVVLDAVLALSEGPDAEVELPDTGDLRADLRTVVRATVDELADPSFEAPLRALYAAMITDADLTAAYRRRVADPVDSAKERRLRSARDAGHLAPDTDLGLLRELLFAPIVQRWLLATGPLDHAFADALVENALLVARAPASTEAETAS